MDFGAKRIGAVVCTMLALIAVLVSCGSDDSDSLTVIKQYAGAVSRQDAKAAAEYTTAASQAAEVLGETLVNMHAEAVDVAVENPVEYSDGTASFRLRTRWSWSDDREFETVTQGAARRLSSGWKVQWEPALLYSSLTTGSRLQMVRTDAEPAPVVRSMSGKPFMQMQPVNEIVLNPRSAKNLDQSVRELAAALKPIAPLVTADVIHDKLRAANGGEVVAVTLRDPDMEVLASNPERISGVTVRKTGMLVMVDRRLSSPLAVGLTNYWQAIRDATSGWQVQLAVPDQAPEELAGHQGPAGPDVLTTVDQSIQLTLGDTVVDVAQPATMMVFDGETGAIRAMAQNTAAADRGVTALGKYKVGTTLGPVFGAVESAVEGKPDAAAAAQSMLNRFGVGLTFAAPGVSAPVGPQQPEIAEVSFSTDDYTASMMSMGALGVSLFRSARGDFTSVAPYVVKDVPTGVSGGELGDLDPAVARQILAEMRKTAQTGDASDITGAPGLRALVGTNGPEGPGWFIGLTGQHVLVIYTEGERSGVAALQVAQKYFRIA